MWSGPNIYYGTFATVHAHGQVRSLLVAATLAKTEAGRDAEKTCRRLNGTLWILALIIHAVCAAQVRS